MLCGLTPLAAQTAPKVLDSGVERPASAIFIGNSFFYYNNSLHNHVTRLVAADEPGYRLRATSVTISGSGANWHDVESYFRPDALGQYSFDDNNNVVFNKIDRLFDLAIMMDCSQCPIHPRLQSVFYEYSRKHSETVRRHRGPRVRRRNSGRLSLALRERATQGKPRWPGSPEPSCAKDC